MWARTRNPLVPVAVLATGVFVDADHLVDYADFKLRGQVRRILIPLHGWEYLVPLWLVGRLVAGRQVAAALCVGYAEHLLLDQLLNRPEHPLTYSAVFRALKRFERKVFSSPERPPDDWVRQPVTSWF